MARFVAVLLAAGWVGTSHGIIARQAMGAQSVTCSVTFSSPLVVHIAGKLAGIAIDDECQNVYLTNHTANAVEQISLSTATLQPPIQVGSMPVGLDRRPGTDLLYVANTGGNNISVVDVRRRVEVRKIITPTEARSTDRPKWIAIANNGLALFTTSHVTMTGGGMYQLDLRTEKASKRTDLGLTLVTEDTRLRPSGDRNAIAIAVGALWPGSVLRYDSAANRFSLPKRLDDALVDVTMDRTGSVLFVAWMNTVLNESLDIRGSAPRTGLGFAVVSPDGRYAYRSRASAIDVLDLRTFAKVGELPIGDTLTPNDYPYLKGQMAISRDGRVLAVITDRGVSLVLAGGAPGS